MDFATKVKILAAGAAAVFVLILIKKRVRLRVWGKISGTRRLIWLAAWPLA